MAKAMSLGQALSLSPFPRAGSSQENRDIHTSPYDHEVSRSS
jgi:hypothetical protein